MRVVVTGSEGYLGCLLVPELLRRGHDVVGIDTGYYRSGWLYNGVERFATTLSRDIRQVEAEDLAGADAVVHMAELSNDPLGDLIPDITYEVNHLGSVRLAEMAKRAGVQRFVYMSSCSVYGLADGEVDEQSEPNPQTAYARCKVLVERDLLAMADDDFSPVLMRNATAYGASPRMRFDIVLNNLAGLAWTTGEIAMLSDGSPWRPLVHALDIGQAICCALDAPREAVHAQTFNVGDTGANHQVRDIAEAVARVIPDCAVSFGRPNGDNRSYRVSFDKIAEGLPGFRCEWTVDRGAQQLRDVFAAVDLDREVFDGRGHTRLKQLEYLMRTRQVDEKLFWTAR